MTAADAHPAGHPGQERSAEPQASGPGDANPAAHPGWARREHSEYPGWELAGDSTGERRIITDAAITAYGRDHIERITGRAGWPPLPAQAWET